MSSGSSPTASAAPSSGALAAPTASSEGLGGAPRGEDHSTGSPQSSQAAANLADPASSSAPLEGNSEDGTLLSKEERRKLNSENQNLRRRLKEFEDAKRAADEAALSDHEKLQKRQQELEAAHARLLTDNQTLRTRMAVERAARQMHLVDEDAAYRLLDPASIEYDSDSGEPTHASVKAALEKLVKAKPYLQATETAQPLNGAPAAPATAPALSLGAMPRPDNGRALTQADEARRQAQVYSRARAAF